MAPLGASRQLDRGATGAEPQVAGSQCVGHCIAAGCGHPVRTVLPSHAYPGLRRLDMHRLMFAFGSAFVALGCTPVQPLVAPVPRYPAMLRGVAAVGDVPVRVKVDRSGTIQSIRVDTQFTTQPAGRELVAFSVQRALREAHFAPARRFGVAVSGHADFVYRFALTRPVASLRSDERPGMTDSLPVSCPSSSTMRIVVVCVPAYPTRARVLH